MRRSKGKTSTYKLLLVISTINIIAPLLHFINEGLDFERAFSHFRQSIDLLVTLFEECKFA